MKLPLGEVSAVLGNGRDADHRLIVSGWSIDSRTVKPGDLFFALAGPRHDGHDHVAAAFAAGAVAAVVRRGWDAPDAVRAGFLFRVDDPQEALSQLAAQLRLRWGGTVVAITGSNGKTTTKDLTAALLGAKLTVSKTEGNLNNEIGLPLSILRIDDEAQVAVLEMGMNHPGEIRRMARIAQPNIGVVTNVSAAHLGHFESIEGIAAAKRELVEELPSHATAVLNADDPLVRTFGERHPGLSVMFGFEPCADFQARDVALAGDGARFRLFRKGRGGNGMAFESHLPGRHNVLNMMAGLAVAAQLGIDPGLLRKAAAGVRSSAMRGQVRRLGDWLVIDDCYNSNPAAAAAMLQLLAGLDAKRKVAVLGEMRELGDSAAALHRDLGRQAGAAASRVFGVAGEARALVAGAIEAGLDPAHTRFFETSEQAGAELPALLEPGDAVLFKASRGVGLEKALGLVAAAVGAGV